jgi:hypothetical protein
MSGLDGGGDDRDAPEQDALAADLIIPALGSGLAIYFLASTTELAWEARATGSVIAWSLLALCALFLLRSLSRLAVGKGRMTFGDLFSGTLFNRQRVALILLCLAFVATIRWVGTTLGIFLLLLATMYVMGVREPRRLFTIASLSAATVYLLFIFLLNSRMPRGYLEQVLARVLPPLGG